MKIIQIIGVEGTIYGLDEDGNVYIVVSSLTEGPCWKTYIKN